MGRLGEEGRGKKEEVNNLTPPFSLLLVKKKLKHNPIKHGPSGSI